MERVTLHSEGTPLCSFKSAASVPIRSLKAHFTPTQNGSGDPSPSNVREIVGRTSLSITQCGKNLFPNTLPSNAIAATMGSSGISKSTNARVFAIRCLPNTNYICSQGTRAGWSLGFSNKLPEIDDSIDYKGSMMNRTTFVINSGNNVYLLICVPNAISYFGDLDNYRPQVELGSVATDYESYTGTTTQVTFPSNGKNRIDTSTGWVTNQNYEENTGRVLTNGGARDNKYTAVIPGETYTMSWTTYGYDMRVVFYRLNDAGNKVATRTLNSTSRSGFTFTVADDEHFIRVSHRTGSYTDIPAGLQLELGSTATAYEAYSSDNTFYGGYVDIIEGKLIGQYKYVLLNDADSWTDGSRAFFYKENLDFFSDREIDTSGISGAGYGNTYGLYCTIAPADNKASFYCRWKSATQYNFALRYASDVQDPPTLADIKTLASNNQIGVCYKLATPVEFPLDSVSLYTYEGLNQIWSSAQGKVEVDYDLFETKMIQDAKRRMLANNQPHLESKTGSIVSFTPHVRAPIEQLRCVFNPVQDLHGYDYSWPAGGGKNILDMADANIVIGKYISNAGVESTNSNNFYNNKYIPVKASTAYTLSMSEKVSYCSIMEYDSSKGFIKRTLFGDGTTAGKIDSATVTMGSTTAYILIGSNMKGSTLSLADVQAVSWQVEEGSTATSWVPYENVCSIDGWTGVNVTKTGANIAESEYVLANTSMYSAVLFIEADLKPSTTYTLSFVGTAGNLCYTNEKLFAYANVSITGSRQSVTFTTKAEISRSTAAQYYSGRGWIILKNAQTQSADNTFTDVQLEVGSSATNYEVYSGAVYNVEFPATKNLFKNQNGDTSSINISAGIAFTVSTKTTSSPYFKATYSDGTNTGYVWMSSPNSDGLYTKTYTPEKDIVSMIIYLSGGVSECQVELGSVATDYEPYGTVYGGYVDLIRGVLVAEWMSNKSLRVVSQTVGTYRTAYRFNLVRYGLAKPYTWSNISCDRAITDGTSENTSNAANYWSCRFAAPGSDYKSGTIWLFVPNGVFNSVADINDYLDSNPIEFCYRLFTPVEYQLTPTQLKAFKGQNNIWSDTNGNTTVKYWTH